MRIDNGSSKSTGGGGGAAVHVVPAHPGVKVHPATRAIEPGPLVEKARAFGVSVEMCGQAACHCTPECRHSPGWDGYVSDHKAIGESEDAYESAEDCAHAALTELRDRINDVL